MIFKRGLFLILALSSLVASSQEISKLDRGRAQDILHGAAEDVRKHYYDPKFHGLDWDAKVAEAKTKIDNKCLRSIEDFRRRRFAQSDHSPAPRIPALPNSPEFPTES